MEWMDVISVGLLGGGVVQGIRKGAAEQAQYIARMAMAFLGGLGVFKLVGGLLSGLLGEGSGFLSFLVSFAVVFIVTRRVRKGLQLVLVKVLSSAPVWLAALLGGTRGLVSALCIIVPMVLAPFDFIRGAGVESFLGQVLDKLFNLQGGV